MRLLVFIICSSWVFPALAQFSVGLQSIRDGNADGYVLFSPVRSKKTFLINKQGQLIHQWQFDRIPGQSVYLLDNGDILRAGFDLGPAFNVGGKGGWLERYSWDGEKLWSFKLSDLNRSLHHDFYPLKNGNILALMWEARTKEEALALGRDSSLLTTWIWSEKVIELKPIGTDSAEIVWEWDLFDHLVQDRFPNLPNYGKPSASPHLINFNFVPVLDADWIHLNGISYNEKLRQIMLSAHTFSEIWLIEHGSSTEISSGHTGGRYNKGGDILYRWGNPMAYQRGDSSDQQFFRQHHAQWIPDSFAYGSNIILFNNGWGRPDSLYSEVEIINPPIQEDGSYVIDSVNPIAPNTPLRTYRLPADDYSAFVSGVQPLENGSYLICSGVYGKFIEIDKNGNRLWEYINPINQNGPIMEGDSVGRNLVFRCTFIKPDHPALAARLLTPGNVLELNPYQSWLHPDSLELNRNQNRWIDSELKVKIAFSPAALKIQSEKPLSADSLFLSNYRGKKLSQSMKWKEGRAIQINMKKLQEGIYFLELGIAGRKWILRLRK